MDLEVSIMMKGGGAKTKIKTEELHFKPLRTWTGAVHKEKVHGWSTVVYEAQARLVAVTAHKTPPTLPLPVRSPMSRAMRPAAGVVFCP